MENVEENFSVIEKEYNIYRYIYMLCIMGIIEGIILYR